VDGGCFRWTGPLFFFSRRFPPPPLYGRLFSDYKSGLPTTIEVGRSNDFRVVLGPAEAFFSFLPGKVYCFPGPHIWAITWNRLLATYGSPGPSIFHPRIGRVSPGFFRKELLIIFRTGANPDRFPPSEAYFLGGHQVRVNPSVIKKDSCSPSCNAFMPLSIARVSLVFFGHDGQYKIFLF